MTKKTKDILVTAAAIILPLGAIIGGVYWTRRMKKKKEAEKQVQTKEEKK